MPERNTRLSKCARLVLPIVAGSLYTLGLAPFGLWYFSLLSAIAFIALVHHRTPKEAFLTGSLYGLGVFGASVSWVYVSIHDFGYTPAVLAAPMTLLFTGGLGLLFGLQAWLYQRLGLQKLYLFTLPALWVAFEWLRSWLLTGFPWAYLGYAFIDTPLRGYAPLIGVLGISLIAVQIATLVYMIISQRRYVLTAYCSVAALWLVGATLDTLSWSRPNLDKPVNVSLVQGNIPQIMKWDPAFQQETMDTYHQLTNNIWINDHSPNGLAQPTDIIVWPEAAIPVFYHEALPYIERMHGLASAHDTTLVTGIPYLEMTEDSYRIYNSMISLDNSIDNSSGNTSNNDNTSTIDKSTYTAGKDTYIYHKQRLVPFGEYVPLESWIRGLIPFFDLPMSSFSRGEKNQAPLQAGPYKLAAFICYEIVYPRLVQQQAANSDFLVTISNDAWFGHSTGPWQHLEMAQMRALETGKYLIRATNTGLTAIVDERGHITSQLPQFTREILHGTIYPTMGQTPYLHWGALPVILYSFLFVAIGYVYSRMVTPKKG